jgi:hypothetical protein
MKRKTHIRDRRLFVNAGITFPKCYSNQEFLDLDKTNLYITGYPEDVTCKNCLKIMKHNK